MNEPINTIAKCPYYGNYYPKIKGFKCDACHSTKVFVSTVKAKAHIATVCGSMSYALCENYPVIGDYKYPCKECKVKNPDTCSRYSKCEQWCLWYKSEWKKIIFSIKGEN